MTGLFLLPVLHFHYKGDPRQEGTKMKKNLTIILVSIIVILLILLGKNTVTSAFGQDYEEGIENTAEGERFAGTWHLSSEIDQSVIDASYPDVYAFGNELTIRPDGRISWHIGAAGAAGTYEVYDNQLSATVSDIMEFDEYRVGLTLQKSGRLVMKYKSVPLEWVYSSEGY